MSAQGFDGGISCRTHIRLTERWSADWSLSASYDNARKDCFWGSLSAGASFAVFDSLHVFAEGIYKRADYIDMDNNDRLLQLTEGLRYNGNYRLTHSLQFDQIRLYYHPSNYSVSCSRMSYSLDRQRNWGDEQKWRTTIMSQVVANIRSEASQVNFVQRVKFGCRLERKLSFRNSRLGVEYLYMVGGKRQTYIGESDKLHRINLFWSFDNRYHKRN